MNIDFGDFADYGDTVGRKVAKQAHAKYGDKLNDVLDIVGFCDTEALCTFDVETILDEAARSGNPENPHLKKMLQAIINAGDNAFNKHFGILDMDYEDEYSDNNYDSPANEFRDEFWTAFIQTGMKLVGKF